MNKRRQTPCPCPFLAAYISHPRPDPCRDGSRSYSTSWMKTPTHPLVLPQIPAPTFVVSPPTTTATGADCGTKMRLRLESAATECEPDDWGMVSISTLVASITPSTAACWAAVGQGAVVLQFLLDAV